MSAMSSPYPRQKARERRLPIRLSVPWTMDSRTARSRQNRVAAAAMSREKQYRAPTTARRPRGRAAAYRSHLAYSSKEKADRGSIMMMSSVTAVTVDRGKISNTANRE